MERSFRGLSIHRDYQGLDETNPADCQCQICLRRDRPVDPFIPVSDSAPSWPRAYEYLRPFLNVFRVDSFSTHDVRSSLTPHPQRGVFLEFQLDLESTDIMPKPESESGLEATQEPEPENQVRHPNSRSRPVDIDAIFPPFRYAISPLFTPFPN